jgi:hypothetical protein
MPLDGVTPGDEHFFPSVAQTSDGRIYLVAGGLFSAVVRVDGLETVRRIPPFPLPVTAGQLAAAEKLVQQRETERQAELGQAVWKISLYSPAAAPDDRDWTDADWVDIDRRGVAAYFDSSTSPYAETAAMAVAGGQLLARWKTGDAQLLENSGAAENAPFKTGGALDLMLGTNPGADPDRREPTAGDIRLLITRVRGKTRAWLYRAIVPGTPPEQRVVFRSPVRTVSFDRVEDVSGRVRLAADGQGDYQIAVPLNLLGWAPRPGAKFKGDIGILRGNGTETMQRAYWSDKATALLADVPGEAALSPGLWGTLVCAPK